MSFALQWATFSLNNYVYHTTVFLWAITQFMSQNKMQSTGFAVQAKFYDCLIIIYKALNQANFQRKV